MNKASQAVSHRNRCEASPEYAKQIEFPELAAAEMSLHHGAEHPQHQHVKQQMKELLMHEAVGQQLVDASVEDIARNKAEGRHDRRRGRSLTCRLQDKQQ